MLKLTDKFWSELSTHKGDATWVPDWLSKLGRDSENIELFNEGCYCLWSDENTWSAAFAAAPHLIEIGAKTLPKIQIEYVKLVGLMAIYRTRPGWKGDHLACPPELENDFEMALGQAAILAAKLLLMRWNDDDTLMLLASLAAFKGYLPIARAIEAGGIICPRCDEVVNAPRYRYDV